MHDDATPLTQDVVSRYFAAWMGRDAAATHELLADDFRFTGLGMEIRGREAFLDAGAFPPDARTTLVAQVCQGSEAFQMYDSVRGPFSVRIVEHLTVANGRLASSAFVTDGAAFAAFVGQGGEPSP